MLSTADKFLGSLLGAYVGNQSGCGQSEKYLECIVINTSQDPFSQFSLAPLYSSCVEFPEVLPWLLRHHDNFLIRHHWISQQLSTITSPRDTLIERLDAAYLLGDCLEWFMQASPNAQHPAKSLQDYLGQRSASYPVSVRSTVAKWLPVLGHISTMASHYEALFSPGPIADVSVAIQQCIYYRENLILALGSRAVNNTSVSTLLGYLMGAWAGTMVIPMDWIVAIPSDAMASLRCSAEGLYRTWAGIADKAKGIDAFPLDL